MKKYLILILLLSSVLLINSCGTSSYYADGNKVELNLPQAPENGIFDAPEEFYLEWDIQSVRDIYITNDGCYSMPVYRIDTYAELLHLKEIVGMTKIGNEIDNTDYCKTCDSEEPCSHDEYNEAFFENYTLLIGWHQYVGVVIPDHVEENDGNGADAEEENYENTIKNVARYDINYDGTLIVYLQGSASDVEETSGQWIFVAVPKSIMAGHSRVAFLVQLPLE